MTTITNMRYFQLPDRDAQIRAQQYFNSDHACFKTDGYPIYFYTNSSNSIRGWQSMCTGKYKDIYDRAYPIDVLLYPDQYPEFYI